MDEKKESTSTWVKVFWLSLMTIIALVSGIWFVLGWIFALVFSIKLFLLYIPAVIIISFYASVIHSLVTSDLELEDWHFLWL